MTGRNSYTQEDTLPELPEVETIRRQLEPQLTGKTISEVKVLDALVTAPAPAAEFVQRLSGQKIAGVTRRGKYLRLELESGDTLVLHLRMTGRLTLSTVAAATELPHLRLLICFPEGNCIAFQDIRRFGKALLLAAAEGESYWRRLGPEPLERSFTAAVLQGILDKRQRPMKPLLLDQALIAGIGNIYADESLYGAAIHPLRPAASVTAGEAEALAKAIKATLRKAIELQGSSIDTYHDANGQKGGFQKIFKVHRRQGEPCRGCGGLVEKIKVGGRGTYFCPRCQKL